MTIRLEAHLAGVPRCPHCSVANPTLERLWDSGEFLRRATQGPRRRWALYRCTSCGEAVLARGIPNDSNTNAAVDAIFPDKKVAHADIPEPARTFLQQAYETLHAPDAAAVMAGSAVDAM
jgi:hypothetical protein